MSLSAQPSAQRNFRSIVSEITRIKNMYRRQSMSDTNVVKCRKAVIVVLNGVEDEVFAFTLIREVCKPAFTKIGMNDFDPGLKLSSIVKKTLFDADEEKYTQWCGELAPLDVFVIYYLTEKILQKKFDHPYVETHVLFTASGSDTVDLVSPRYKLRNIKNTYDMATKFNESKTQVAKDMLLHEMAEVIVRVRMKLHKDEYETSDLDELIPLIYAKSQYIQAEVLTAFWVEVVEKLELKDTDLLIRLIHGYRLCRPGVLDNVKTKLFHGMLMKKVQSSSISDYKTFRCFRYLNRALQEKDSFDMGKQAMYDAITLFSSDTKGLDDTDIISCMLDRERTLCRLSIMSFNDPLDRTVMQDIQALFHSFVSVIGDKKEGMMIPLLGEAESKQDGDKAEEKDGDNDGNAQGKGLSAADMLITPRLALTVSLTEEERQISSKVLTTDKSTFLPFKKKVIKYCGIIDANQSKSLNKCNSIEALMMGFLKVVSISLDRVSVLIFTMKMLLGLVAAKEKIWNDMFSKLVEVQEKSVFLGICYAMPDVIQMHTSFEIHTRCIDKLFDMAKHRDSWNVEGDKICLCSALAALGEIIETSHVKIKDYAKSQLKKAYPTLRHVEMLSDHTILTDIDYLDKNVIDHKKASGIVSLIEDDVDMDDLGGDRHDPTDEFHEMTYSISNRLLKSLEKLKAVRQVDLADLPPNDKFLKLKGSVTTANMPPEDLVYVLKSFLVSPPELSRVLLLQGSSGCGRSTSLKKLEELMWSLFPYKGLIPIYINVPHVLAMRQKHMMSAVNDILGEDLDELKNKPVVILLDDYDLIQFSYDNILNQIQAETWLEAKFIITTNNELFNCDLLPEHPDWHSFTRVIIQPLNQPTVDDFVERYLLENSEKVKWDWEEYLGISNSVEGFSELLGNPIVLKLAMEVLPLIKKTGATKLFRKDIYDLYFKRYFQGAVKSVEKQKKKFRDLEDPATFLKGYPENLAISLWHRNTTVIYYDTQETSNNIQKQFDVYFKPTTEFNEKIAQSVLPAKGIKVTESGKLHQFSHSSILDYFVVEKVLADLVQNDFITINMSSLVDDESKLSFLRDSYYQGIIRDLKKRWMDLILRSSSNMDYAIGAANAITLMNSVGVAFSGMDMRNIHIEGANMTGAILGGTNLSSSHLKHVKFTKAYLDNAILSGSTLQGATFNQHVPVKLPNDSQNHQIFVAANNSIYTFASHDRIITMYTETGEKVRSFGLLEDLGRPSACVIDGSGSLAALGLNRAPYVRILDTNRRMVNRSLHGMRSAITSICISSRGNQCLLTCHDQIKVLCYNIRTTNLLAEHTTHKRAPNQVGCSTDGSFFIVYDSANGAKEFHIAVIDTDTHEVVFNLDGHSQKVVAHAFSVQNQLATGSMDNTCKVWSLKTGDCLSTIHEHKHPITELGFGLDRLMTCSNHETVAYVWQVGRGQTGKERCRFSSHEGRILCAICAPIGSRQIALTVGGGATSSEYSWRVWSTDDGKQLCLFDWEMNQRAYMFKFDGDCSHIFCVYPDHTIRKFNIEDDRGKLVFKVSGHTAPVVYYSMKTKLDELLSVSEDGTARFWTANDTNEAVAVQTVGGSHVYLAISQGGKYLLSMMENTIRVWEIATGNFAHCIRSDKTLTAAAIGFRSVMGVGDSSGRIFVWNLNDGFLIRNMRAFEDEPVGCIAFSVNCSIMAASPQGSRDIRVFKVMSGQKLEPLRCDEPVKLIAFSPDTNFVIATSESTAIFIFDLAHSRLYHTLQLGHTKFVTTLTFTSDSSVMATGSYDRTIRLWRLLTGEKLTQFKGHKSAVKGLQFSEDATNLYSLSDDGDVRVHNINAEDLEALQPKKQANTVSCVAFSPDNKLLLAAVIDVGIVVVRSSTGKIKHTHPHSCETMLFSPNGKYLACYKKFDRLITILEVIVDDEGNYSFVDLYHLRRHTDSIQHVSWHPESNIIATASSDKSIVLWDLLKKGEIWFQQYHNGVVHHVTFDKSGARVASCSFDGCIKVFSVETADPLWEYSGCHESACLSVKFNPEGTCVFSAGGDGKICRLGIVPEEGKQISSLVEHKSAVSIMTFVPRNIFGVVKNILVTGSRDKSVIVWNSDCTEAEHVLSGHKAEIRAIHHSPIQGDGSTEMLITVASAGRGGFMDIMLWDLETGHVLHNLREESSSFFLPTAVTSSAPMSICAGGYKKSMKLWNIEIMPHTDGGVDAIASLQWRTRSIFSCFEMDVRHCTGISSMQAHGLRNLGAILENKKET